jgi:hypothetical protein
MNQDSVADVFVVDRPRNTLFNGENKKSPEPGLECGEWLMIIDRVWKTKLIEVIVAELTGIVRVSENEFSPGLIEFQMGILLQLCSY